MTDAQMEEQAACMGAICHGEGNSVAWLILEDAGMTQDIIRAASEGAGWMGPKPIWSSVPSDGMRKAYEARKAKGTTTPPHGAEETKR